MIIIKTKNLGHLSLSIHDERVLAALEEGYTLVKTYELESLRDGVLNRKTKWIISELKENKK